MASDDAVKAKDEEKADVAAAFRDAGRDEDDEIRFADAEETVDMDAAPKPEGEVPDVSSLWKSSAAEVAAGDDMTDVDAPLVDEAGDKKRKKHPDDLDTPAEADDEEELLFDIAGSGTEATVAADVREVEEEGLSDQEKRRRRLFEDSMETQRQDQEELERRGKTRAGFFAAAAAATAAGAADNEAGEAGADMRGRVWLQRKWLKDPKRFKKILDLRMDAILEKALNNDWKYVAVTRGGTIDPTVAALLQNRIAVLSVNTKEADRILARMGFDSAEARIAARQKLQQMVVLQSTFNMKNFHRLGKGEAAPAATMQNKGEASDLRRSLKENSDEVTRPGVQAAAAPKASRSLFQRFFPSTPA